VPHPVAIFGRAIGYFDQHFNSEILSKAQRKQNGVVAILALSALAVVTGVVLHWFLMLFGPIGILVEIFCVAIFLAQKSLSDHVAAVVTALRSEGLVGGRKAVSRIVGRDPETLDEPAVCRAAIESLAENFSDGIVAPVFWMAVAGLPGAVAYKAVNTGDSMIGHRTPRFEAFGWATARLDDLLNLPASRLSALFIAIAAFFTGGSLVHACRVVWRDASQHRSPNAGWPEAAMAGALGLQLAGPRVYGDELVVDAFMGDGTREATATDIRKALRIFVAACVVQWLVLAAICLVIWRG
jgi:adenosylcobinamide-phosphate synthase